MTGRRAATALVAVLLSACGSTVEVTGQRVVGTGDLGTSTGGELGTTGGTGSYGTAGTTGGTGSSLAGTSGGSTSGSSTGSGSLDPTSGGTTGGPALVGPGVTPTSMAIGLRYAVNSKAAASALGAAGDGVGGGDDRVQWKIVLDDLNAHGGVLGRKVLPVFHAEDSTDQSPIVQQEQTACSDWTEDHKVFAVIAQEVDPSNTLLSCVQKAGAAQLYSDLTRSDAQTFAQFPYYLETGTLGMDRVAAAWPRALQRQGFFTGWNTATGAAGPLPVKVGIISFGDRVTVRAVERQLKPALAAIGHPAVDWVQVSYPTSAADNGRSISETQAATLKFNADHITHVLPFDAQGAGIGAFFSETADSQRYYPRYGLNSGVGAQTLHDTGLWPSSQLRGAMGFGWVPLLDLPFAQNPASGPYANSSRRSCIALMSAHGEDMSSAIVQRQAVAKCDELRFLRDALEAGGAPNRQALVVGAHRLRNRFVAGMTFSTFYDPTRHDGVASARDFAYDVACSCFRYTSTITPVA